MPDLEVKLAKEMTNPSTTTIIACRFPFPTWREIAIIGQGIDTVWVYKVPK